MTNPKYMFKCGQCDFFVSINYLKGLEDIVVRHHQKHVDNGDNE